MNDHLVALVCHKHDDLEKIRGAVGTDDEPTVGIVAQILDDHRVPDGVQHVLIDDAVAAGCGVDLHT